MAERHPDIHAPWKSWSEDQKLHVATCYINPLRLESRRRLMNNFRREMEASANVVLHVSELAYGDRPHEVTSPDNPLDLQLRTGSELWHKENVLNLVIQRFPADWKYGCYIDADVSMSRWDWALETVHLLQHYDWIQMFSQFTDLAEDNRSFGTMDSFSYCYARRRGNTSYSRFLRAAAKGKAYSVHPAGPGFITGATGLAWAFRRPAYDTCGGLLDTCIVGSGDWHMAFGLVGAVDPHVELQKGPGPYVDSILRWQHRASELKANIGYMENHLLHHFHGSRDGRGYRDRWMILADNQYDPRADICRDYQGAYRLCGNKPRLRDDLRDYFRGRREDSRELSVREAKNKS